MCAVRRNDAYDIDILSTETQEAEAQPRSIVVISIAFATLPRD
jgi:hypothetical protein